MLITGFNNDSSLLHSDKRMHIVLDGLLMNTGKAHLEYSIPLGTNQMVFDCWGKLGPISFAAFNPMLETNVNMRAKKGVADAMSFNFHAIR